MSQYTTYGVLRSSVESFRRMKYSGMLSDALDRQVLVLARQPHVEPAAAARDDLAAPARGSTHCSSGSFMSSRKSCLLSRISTPSVSMVTVALRLASAISASSPKVSPTPSSASLMPSWLQRRLARHHALAVDDDVEVIAFVALLDDHVAGAARHALQAHERSPGCWPAGCGGTPWSAAASSSSRRRCRRSAAGPAAPRPRRCRSGPR